MPTDFEDLQIEAAEAVDGRTRDRIAAKPSRTPRESWILESGADLRALIQPIAVSSYLLPSVFQKMMPRVDFADLQAVFDLVRELNAECVGLTVGEGEILLGLDPRVAELERTAAPVLKRILQARVDRPNPKDKTEPVARFFRIQHEVLGPLDRILDLQPSVHSVCLTTSLDRAAWELRELTWASKTHLWRERGHLRAHFDVADRWQRACHNITDLYGWQCRGDLEWLLELYATRVPVRSTIPVSAMQRRLQELAADLGHMRPLLIRDTTARSTCFPASADLTLGFSFGLGRRVGMVLAAANEPAFIECEQKNHFPIVLSVGHDGLLSPDALPWINALELPGRNFLLAANLAIVERVHARLFALYERVDQAALVAQFRRPDSHQTVGDESVVAEDEDEAVAAAASLVTSVELPAEPEEPNRPAVRRVHGTRLSAFRRVLESFGCEFRTGKGSELVIHRPGSVIARIGQHQKDPELSSTCVRVALRRLGISVFDYLTALTA